MTTDRTTALREAIAGERRDWHRTEVDPSDIAALLDRLERTEAVVEAAELVLSLDASFRPNGVTRYPQLARAVTTYLAALDSAASDDH